MFRLPVKGKDKSKVIEEKRVTEVGEDEVIMKTKEVEAMKSAIAQFERVSTDESGDAKMVVMNKKQMLIGIGHYNQMRKKSKEV